MNHNPLPPSADYWKQKISAFLHDSPDKALGILGHENRAESLANVFGFEKNEEFRKDADFAASAADRLPWPSYKTTKCKSDYDTQGNPFRHPLSGKKIRLDTHRDDVERTQHETMPLLHQDDFGGDHYCRTALRELGLEGDVETD